MTKVSYAEFCFLCTDDWWFYSRGDWDSHCAYRLRKRAALVMRAK
jgi:hypothetical protein